MGAAAEFDVTVESPSQELVVENPWPADRPTVYVVGLPDRAQKPVRLTQGVSLNGVRLTERLLSESVLILYPDGTGKWGYHAGFDIFREPDIRDGKRIDPRTLIEYEKWKYDPLKPVSAVGGDLNMLRLFNRRPYPPASYEIAFAEPITIRKLKIGSNCDQILQPGVEVLVKLYADATRTELLAERKRGGKNGRFPVTFEGVDRNRVVVEISATAPKSKFVYLYWLSFEADLAAPGLELPTLQQGRNVLHYSDDPDSSHRARIVLRWFEKPTPDRVWDDFEGATRWSRCSPTLSSPENGVSFTGAGFGRMSFPANGKNFMIHRGFPKPLDLTRFNRLGLALRVRNEAPMIAIQFGVRNEKGPRYQYVRQRPGKRWTYQTHDISKFARDQVTAFNLHFTATQGYSRPGVPCEYDVDSLCFYYEPPAPQEEKKLPERIASHKSPHAAAPPRSDRPAPPLQEWFPMGVYCGVLSMPDQSAVFLLDQMARLNMNAIYVSNGVVAELERILPLAEARGVRLIYQGTSAGNLYYLHYATEQARVGTYNRQIAPSAAKWIPKFNGRWGLAAWSLTEEIRPEVPPELKPYYKLVRDLAPAHPPTVLHNNLASAKVDLETNRPLVITHDFYPFFWAPTSGPSNPRRSIHAYRARVSSYYKACRDHGASLWMMPQAWGTSVRTPLDPPYYGYRTGMRTPEPGEIKQQGWLAIAEGATGVMYYATVARRPDSRQLWDYGWEETDNTRAAGALFAAVTKVAPLLCRLERDYKESGFVKVAKGKAAAHSFVKRKSYPGPARYVVVASLDGFEPQTVTLEVSGGGEVFDLLARTAVGKGGPVDVPLEPGGGAVFLVGSREQFEADCAMIDEQLKEHYR